MYNNKCTLHFLWNRAFIGPSLGGYLIDEIGYTRATEAAIGLKAFVVSNIFTSLFLLWML